MNKKEIRKIVNERRKVLTEAEIKSSSEAIKNYLITLPSYENAPVIYSYVDFNHEVETWPIMEHALAHGKKVAVPRVEGKTMDFYYITSKDDLESGYYGIMEPKKGLPVAQEPDAFMVMPGVAFDRSHHRVGYGGGFYDRFLEKWPNIYTAAVAFECQMFDEVPFEEFDILPDVLITEAGISKKQ